MNLPMEAPDVEVVAGTVDVVFITRIKDDPSAITLIDLKKAAGCAGLRNHSAVVLRSPTKIESIARRHVEVIKHRYREAVAAILPVRAAVFADVNAAVVGIID